MGNCQTYNEDELATISPKSHTRLQLTVRTETWMRDSYGLFDYENKNKTTSNFKSYTSGRVIRTGTDVSQLKENMPLPDNQETKELFQTHLKDGNFWIGPAENSKMSGGKQEYTAEDLEKIDSGLWLVIKSLKNKHNTKGYQLSEGDLLKLGRVKLKVVEMKKTASQPPRGPDIEIAKRSGTEPDSPLGDEEEVIERSNNLSVCYKESSGQVCRICLSENSEPGNPLFNPCKCAGTMKYVHIKCLQTWLKSKLYIKDMPQVLSFYLKSFECELCKTLFPNVFEINGVKYGIVEMERPNTPYLILEVLSKDGGAPRGLHLVRMDKKNSIRLGRGHDSDIRISDISVSRFHATLKMEKDGFYIEDNDSKFGTLAYMNKPFAVVGAYENASIQIGRTVASFSVKKSWRMFSTCIKSQALNQINVTNEIKPEMREIPKASPMNPVNPVVINEQPVMINRRAGFGVRSDRAAPGPQRPLEGDDDAVEIEEPVYDNQGNRRQTGIEENLEQGRNEGENEDIVVREL